MTILKHVFVCRVCVSQTSSVGGSLPSSLTEPNVPVHPSGDEADEPLLSHRDYARAARLPSPCVSGFRLSTVWENLVCVDLCKY